MARLTPEQWLALSPQLDIALGLNDEERAAWFASLRAADPLVAEQLQQLMDEHFSLVNDGFLDKSPVDIAETKGLTGHSLGSYTLKSQIGQGGMGSVWLAERNDGRFERVVAVKFLNLALLGESGEARFRQEGIILGRLAHSHIAELLDAGVLGTGQPYLVLEHVEGSSIDRYCDEKNLDVQKRIELFIDALEAVAHAHQHLIVHRDIKPSNVLIRNDGCVKLLDFGIAKLLEDDSPGAEAKHTLNAMTPQYAAPEQLTGQAVTPATDIYALGILLYVLLTGRHPSGNEKSSPAELVKAILETQPELPSKAVTLPSSNLSQNIDAAAKRGTTPDKLSRTLRGDLDTIICKATKKNASERYGSAKAFAEDLRRYLNNEPISARPDSISYRAGKFLRRNRLRVTVALLITVALILAPTAAWLMSHRSDRMVQYKQRRLTANPKQKPVRGAAISPDGKYIGYGDQDGIHLQIVESGTAQNVTLPPVDDSLSLGNWVFGSWYPDSTRFIAGFGLPGLPVTLWTISTTGEAPKRIVEVAELTGPAKISPDGSKIAFRKGIGFTGSQEIWLMDSNGENQHRIKTAGNRAAYKSVGWSPGGNRIVYEYTSHHDEQMNLFVLSCNLDGNDETTIVHDNRLTGSLWVAPERFIYTKSADPGGIESGNIWELRLDGVGTPQSAARRITDWSGFSVFELSASAKGNQLAFLRGIEGVSISIGEFARGEKKISSSRVLDIDDNYNIPLAWTPDSRELIFSSKRAANRLVYKTAISGSVESKLLTAVQGTHFYLARPTPDGKALIVEGAKSTALRKFAFYRVAPEGGVPQFLFNADDFNLYFCPNNTAHSCVFGQMDPQKDELVIYSFDDAMGGNIKEILRIALEPHTSARIGDDYSWQLSPDGSQIAMMRRQSNQIRLIPLDGGKEKVIEVKTNTGLDLTWGFNSKYLFVSTLGADGAGISRVDLDDNEQPIWIQHDASWASGLQSPDGRHLAMFRASNDANVWLIDDF